MQKIGFIGFGNLGQLLGFGFIGYARVSFFDPNVESIKNVIKLNSIAELVKDNEVIIIATPANPFKDIVIELSKLDLRDKLIIDVLSTKMLAINTYSEYLKEQVSILSLHPLFGPPSMSVIKPGLKIVSVFKRGELAERMEKFLANDFGFNIVRVTADQHDKHMAIHHAIPFLLANALSKTDFNKDPGDLTIPSEEKLRQIVNIASKESLDLYYTIMRSNPYAEQAVDSLIDVIKQERQLLWQN